jgi:hypothetical protein
VPTVADVLGAKFPWKVKGKSILDPHSGVSQKTVTITERAGPTITRPIAEWERMLDARRREQIRLFGTGSEARVYDIGPDRQLHGKRVSTLRVLPRGRYSTPLYDKTFFGDMQPDSPFFPTNTAGRIDGGSLPRGLPVAVAVNGVIAATGRTVRLPHDRRAYYTMMVPPWRFHAGRNRIVVYLIRGGALLPIGGT